MARDDECSGAGKFTTHSNHRPDQSERQNSLLPRLSSLSRIGVDCRKIHWPIQHSRAWLAFAEQEIESHDCWERAGPGLFDPCEHLRRNRQLRLDRPSVCCATNFGPSATSCQAIVCLDENPM